MKRKEKAKPNWTIEKTKFDNVRHLRRFFLWAKRWTFKLAQKAARRMLELPMPAGNALQSTHKDQLWNPPQYWETKTQHACVTDADGCTRSRPRRAGHKRYQDHFTVKGMNSITDYSFVLEFIPMSKALHFSHRYRRHWKNNGKNWRKARRDSLRKSKNRNKVIEEVRNKDRKTYFASLLDHCHLKNSELQTH